MAPPTIVDVFHWRPGHALQEFRKALDKDKDGALDAAWLRLFGEHPPAGAPRGDAEVVAEYELVKRSADENGVKMTERFMRNYTASKVLLANREEALKGFTETMRAVLHKGSRLDDTLLDYGTEAEPEGGSTTQEDGMSAKKRKNKKAPKRAARMSKPAATEKASPKARELTPNWLIIDMLLEQNHTDEAIAEAVMRKFPGREIKSVMAQISGDRADVNAGRVKRAPAGLKVERIEPAKADA